MRSSIRSPCRPEPRCYREGMRYWADRDVDDRSISVARVDGDRAERYNPHSDSWVFNPTLYGRVVYKGDYEPISDAEADRLIGILRGRSQRAG